MEPQVKLKLSFFVSYARANKSMATRLLEKYKEQIGASKFYDYRLWQDTEILAGEKWHQEIQNALAQCDLGIILLSPSFLGSTYIKESELPIFTGNDAKLVIPVMLQPISFDRHSLMGIQEYQIFRLDADGFKEPRSFGECKAPRQDDFVRELFNQIELRLDKYFRQNEILQYP